MLIACPECAHEVSDRAAACPKCGFPIAEHVAEKRATVDAEKERSSRELTNLETDCTPCKGRGFRMLKWTRDDGTEAEGFEWCPDCGHTGRRPVARSTGGYFAVAKGQLDAFIKGEIGPDSPHVISLGDEPPDQPSYPESGGGGASSTS